MTTHALPLPTADDLDDLLADIGDRIRSERQARGWAQPELARRAGLGLTAVKRLELGQATLLSNLVMACAALDVDMGHLLSRQWRPPEAGSLLSRRQVEILREAASVTSLEELGRRLGMTVPAVGSCLSRIYQRLEVTHLPRSERRASAVRVAIQHGLFDSLKRTS